MSRQMSNNKKKRDVVLRGEVVCLTAFIFRFSVGCATSMAVSLSLLGIVGSAPAANSSSAISVWLKMAARCNIVCESRSCIVHKRGMHISANEEKEELVHTMNNCLLLGSYRRSGNLSKLASHHQHSCPISFDIQIIYAY